LEFYKNYALLMRKAATMEALFAQADIHSTLIAAKLGAKDRTLLTELYLQLWLVCYKQDTPNGVKIGDLIIDTLLKTRK